jgi:cytoskeletal protein RodZ
VSVGDALAQARGQAGLTIAQVSQRTCIRETIIRGIERGDFSACGGDFYARGHIRSIARVVGAEPEDLIREYDAAHGAPSAITAAEVFEPATPIRLRERRSLNWSIVMVLALALVLGYGVFKLVDHGGPSRPLASTQTHTGHKRAAHKAAPTAPSPSPSHSAASTGHDLVIQLTAIQDCWVEFTKPDGTYLSQAYIVGGSSRTWHFRHAVTMQIGNPGGIQLTVNGRDLGHPGTYGQPVTLNFGPGRKLPPAAAAG